MSKKDDMMKRTVENPGFWFNIVRFVFWLVEKFTGKKLNKK